MAVVCKSGTRAYRVSAESASSSRRTAREIFIKLMNCLTSFECDVVQRVVRGRGTVIEGGLTM